MKPTLGTQQYIYIALAIIAMCLAGASLVFAEGDAPAAVSASAAVQANVTARPTALASTTANVRQSIDARRAAFASTTAARAKALTDKKAAIQQRIADRRAKLSEAFQQRVTSLADAIAARLSDATTRLGATADRIEARANDLDARGADTNEARASLDAARMALQNAAASLDGIDVDIQFAVTSDDPKGDWQDAKKQFKTVQGFVAEARGDLHDAVAALRQAAADAGLQGDASAAVTVTTTGNIPE